MLAGLLPISPDRNQEDTNHKRCNDFGRFPLCRDTTRNREGDKDQRHHGDHENQPDNIKMPEQF